MSSCCFEVTLGNEKERTRFMLCAVQNDRLQQAGKLHCRLADACAFGLGYVAWAPAVSGATYRSSRPVVDVLVRTGCRDRSGSGEGCVIDALVTKRTRPSCSGSCESVSVCGREDDGAKMRCARCGVNGGVCLLYTSPSPRDGLLSRMPSSA